MRLKQFKQALCACVACLMMCMAPCVAQASELSDAVDKAKELAQEKSQAEDDVKEYNEEIDETVAEIEGMQDDIEEKQEEVDEAQEEYVAAQAVVDEQYAEMKIRIKYIYESGDTQMIEVIMGAEDFSDLLNRIDYVTEMSDYDREKLEEFQVIAEDLEEKRDKLQEEYQELKDMEEELQEKQDELTQMVADLEVDIEDLEAAIEENNAKIEALGGAAALIISGDLKFEHPCPGYTRYSSGFGPRTAPIAGASTNHKGQDMAAPSGTPIYAAESGTVTAAGYSGNAGNRIIINHGSGLETEYMHCSQLYVSVGQKVERGEKIGAVGSTGNSTGPHLHFQVMINGTAVNPLNYL